MYKKIVPVLMTGFLLIGLPCFSQDKLANEQTIIWGARQDAVLNLMDYFYTQEPIVDLRFNKEIKLKIIRQSELEGKLSERKDLLVKAENAAQTSRDPKIRWENTEAVQILRQAIAKTEKALNIVGNSILRLTNALTTYKKMREDRKPVGLSSIKGTVQYKGQDGKWHNYEDVPYMVSKEIRTGQDSSADIIFPDGARLHLGPLTNLVLGEEFRLNEGKVHFEIPVWYEDIYEKVKGFKGFWKINTNVVRSGVRGTEFDLEAEESGLSHLTMYDGKMDLSVEKEVDLGKVNRWWEGSTKEATTVRAEAGKTMKVYLIQGDVKVQKGKDAPLKQVPVGYVMEPDDKLVTGTNSLVHLITHRGFTVTLGEKATLQFKFAKDTGSPLYYLTEGILHVKEGGVSETRQVFLTPNNVINTEKSEFDIRVFKNKAARITPYSGSLSVEAKMDRLEETEIDRWWDEVDR